MVIQKIISALIILLGSSYTMLAIAFPSESSALLHRLFDPLPEEGKTVDRFNLMIAKTDRDIRAGAERNRAVMQAARLFILNELSIAFRSVALLQGSNSDYAPIHAQEYLWINIEEPYQEAMGRKLFEENPATLPRQFFAIYYAAYTFPYFIEHPLPEPERTINYKAYLISIRLMLNYATDLIAILQNILTLLGVPVLPQ